MRKEETPGLALGEIIVKRLCVRNAVRDVVHH